MFDREEALPSRSGANIHLLSRKADGDAKGVVQINHGLAEHALRYSRFAEAMAAYGFHVFAHDHRGHGTTTAPGAPLGSFAQAGEDGVTKIFDDVLSVHELIRERHPALPIVTFGHSMGGLIALSFAVRHPETVGALAIWNANFSAGVNGRVARAVLAWERFRFGSDVPSQMLPRLTFQAWGKAVPDHRTLFDWLSHDPDEVDRYIADPLCGWDASVGLWQGVFRMIFIGADNRNLAKLPRDLPIHLVGGVEDPATNKGRAVLTLGDRLDTLGFTDVSTTIYADTRHETLNEINRDAVTADFADWVEHALASRMQTR